MKGIPLLMKAIPKLQLYDSQLTSVHADICQLCLLAKCFKPALELLDIDITGICQEVRRYTTHQLIFHTVFLYRHHKVVPISMQNTICYIIITAE